jgi:DNA polymerase delta subunit 2
VVKILAVGEDREVAVIGTLYKDMKLKPTILDEYAKDPGLRQALGAGACLCSDSDGLVLEDDGARMSLTGDAAALPVGQYVTGAGGGGGTQNQSQWGT